MINKYFRLGNFGISFWWYGKRFNFKNIGIKSFGNNHFAKTKIFFIVGHVSISKRIKR